MHPKGENNFVKKGPKTHKIQDGGMFTWKFKMAAIFVKLYTSLPIHRCIELSNPSRIVRDAILLKIFVIPGGNATPHKFQRGDTSAPLPNRSGRYQGTTPTTWLNFNTPCKSQLKNAWPFSPTTVPLLLSEHRRNERILKETKMEPIDCHGGLEYYADATYPFSYVELGGCRHDS